MQFPADMPKSARIAAVCQREISALAVRVAGCACSVERSRLLRQQRETQQLLNFALNQEDYQGWLKEPQTTNY